MAAFERRLAEGVGRHAGQVEPDRLKLVAYVANASASGDPVRGGQLARHVGVVHVGLIRLRREDRPLQRDERGIGRLQAAVDLRIVIHGLLVVVEPEAWQEPQSIVHRPFELSEERGAHVGGVDVRGLAVSIE